MKKYIHVTHMLDLPLYMFTRTVTVFKLLILQGPLSSRIRYQLFSSWLSFDTDMGKLYVVCANYYQQLISFISSHLLIFENLYILS